MDKGDFRCRALLPLMIMTAVIWSAGCDHAEHGYHKYIMRGSILEANEKEVDLCIGTRDGARVGQELDVYEIVGSVAHKTPGGVADYRREKTGVVRITSIYNEHYAKAVIVSGRAVKNSIAEIEIHD